MRQMQASLTAVRNAQDEGLLYDVSESGQPRMRVIAQSSSPRDFAGAEIWRTLVLSPEDGRLLSRDLRLLLEK
jgi:hypothetical protein